MSKWKPGHLPNSVGEYGVNHQIWTDMDLAKFAFIAFVFGVITGILF